MVKQIKVCGVFAQHKANFAEDIKSESYNRNKQVIAFKMRKPSLTYQQKQWIEDAYQTAVENSEALGYESIDEHLDEIANDIKEEVDYVFKCEIETILITNLIQNGKKKHF